MQPSHPLAIEFLERAHSWAAEIATKDDRIQCFAIGSIFRTDFDPNRSDFDLVILADSAHAGTPTVAAQLVKDIGKSIEALRSSVRDSPRIAAIPISPSAYFTEEVAANTHRTGDPHYYYVTRFVPLTSYEKPISINALARSMQRGDLHFDLHPIVGFSQQVRHLYLLPPEKRGDSKKPWEKLFHHLRAVLRFTGDMNPEEDVPDRKTVIDILAKRFANSDFPFREMYQSLTDGYDVTRISFDTLLVAFESVCRIVWRANSDFGSRWIYPESRYFADRDVLPPHSVHDLFAVDRGVCLYAPPDFKILPASDIEIVAEPAADVPATLVNPSEAQLLSWPASSRDDAIAKFLQKSAIGGAKGHFQTKVGLAGVDFPNPRIGRPLTLHLYPLSYWTVSAFNRHILTSRDPQLLSLKNERLKELLKPTTDSLSLGFPAALYLEAALVTSDEKVVVLRKHSRLSALAGVGFSMTCSLEEGFVWHRDVFNFRLGIEGALNYCLAQELKLPGDAVKAVTFHGIALEATHLNAALLAVVQLSLDAHSLTPHIKSSEDFVGEPVFVPLDSVVTDLFIAPRWRSREWHPLGRMRALLAVYSLRGRNLDWGQGSETSVSKPAHDAKPAAKRTRGRVAKAGAQQRAVEAAARIEAEGKEAVLGLQHPLLFPFLEWYHSVKLWSHEGQTFPAIVFPLATPKNEASGTDVLGPWNCDNARASLEEEFSFVDRDYVELRRTVRTIDNKQTFCLDKIVLQDDVPIVHSNIVGRYEDCLATCDVLEAELLQAFGSEPPNSSADFARFSELKLPRRNAARIFSEERGFSSHLVGAGRSCALAISTLMLAKRQDGSFVTFIGHRSAKTAAHPHLLHVAPSGMFQPVWSWQNIGKHMNDPNYKEEWSIRHHVLQEVAEELFGAEIHEAFASKPPETPAAIFRHPEVKFLSDLLSDGRAKLFLTGVVVNLLNLRAEFATVLVINEPNWYEWHREGSHGLRDFSRNWEFLDREQLKAKDLPEFWHYVVWSPQDGDLSRRLLLEIGTLAPTRFVVPGAISLLLGLQFGLTVAEKT